MARIKTISHRTNGDFPSARVIVHAPIALEMEQEGEVSQSRIRLLYQDVHKFKNDESDAGKVPKMLWEMLQGHISRNQPTVHFFSRNSF
jgi:hypothetical protein